VAILVHGDRYSYSHGDVVWRLEEDASSQNRAGTEEGRKKGSRRDHALRSS
jgi:hypothetical protein